LQDSLEIALGKRGGWRLCTKNQHEPQQQHIRIEQDEVEKVREENVIADNDN